MSWPSASSLQDAWRNSPQWLHKWLHLAQMGLKLLSATGSLKVVMASMVAFVEVHLLNIWGIGWWSCRSVGIFQATIRMCWLSRQCWIFSCPWANLQNVSACICAETTTIFSWLDATATNVFVLCERAATIWARLFVQDICTNYAWISLNLHMRT